MVIISIYMTIGLLIMALSIVGIYFIDDKGDKRSYDNAQKAKGELNDLFALRGPMGLLLIIVMMTLGWPYFVGIAVKKRRNG